MDHVRRPSPSPRLARRRRAFTLIEAILLLTILSIVAVAAGVGLQSGVRGPDLANDTLAVDRAIASQIEVIKQTAILSWNSLSGLAGSSTVTINGRPLTQTISIVAQPKPDGSNGTANDFVKVSVSIGNQSIVTYLAQP